MKRTLTGAAKYSMARNSCWRGLRKYRSNGSAAGEEATIATWQGVLEEGTYLMLWTTPRHGGVELEFTLLKRFGVLEVGAYRERQIMPDPPLSP